MTKILLVEDDKSLREIYGVRLQAEGYEITSAGNGEEALALAIKERPNLIISDVMMPKISGFDMLDILRSTTETKDIRVIMMTALGSEDQRQRGEALGADRYLVKSQVGIEDVVRTVHEVMGDPPGANATVAQQPHPIGQTTTPGVPTNSIPQSQAMPTAPAAPVLPPVAVPPTPQLVQQPASPPVPAPVQPMPAQSPIAPPAMTTQPIQPQTAVPQPIPQSQAMPTAPAAPVLPPVAVPPTPQPTPVIGAPQAGVPPSLPQPMAPFSSPRPGNLGDRIIQPIVNAQSDIPDNLADRMSQELSGAVQAPIAAQAPSTSAPAPTSVPAQPVQMPTPQSEQLDPSTPPQPMTPIQPPSVAPASNLEFEETPREQQQT